MPEAPRLTDGVLVLDAFAFDDVPAHVAGEDDEHARRFGWFPLRSTEATARGAIQQWNADWANDGDTRSFAAREAASGELVGGCQLRFRGDGVMQLAYWIFPHRRGRGYAQRAVELVCGFAFDRLGIERVEAIVEPDNLASRGVLTAVGFVEEGVLRNRGSFPEGRRDMVMYSLLPSDR
jgi:RimJ/RimL family protein N-acetyltransferase